MTKIILACLIGMLAACSQEQAPKKCYHVVASQPCTTGFNIDL